MGDEELFIAPVRDDETLNLSLDGWEGPLDLLLNLARNQKVDLAQISILALAAVLLWGTAAPASATEAVKEVAQAEDACTGADCPAKGEVLAVAPTKDEARRSEDAPNEQLRFGRARHGCFCGGRGET